MRNPISKKNTSKSWKLVNLSSLWRNKSHHKPIVFTKPRGWFRHHLPSNNLLHSSWSHGPVESSWVFPIKMVISHRFVHFVDVSQWISMGFSRGPPQPLALWPHVGEVGMASVDPKVATYTEFAEVVLPRIKRALGGDRGSLDGWALVSRAFQGLFIGFKVSLWGCFRLFTHASRLKKVECESCHFGREHGCWVLSWGMGYNAVQLMAVAEHAHYGAKLSHG